MLPSIYLLTFRHTAPPADASQRIAAIADSVLPDTTKLTQALFDSSQGVATTPNSVASWLDLSQWTSYEVLTGLAALFAVITGVYAFIRWLTKRNKTPKATVQNVTGQVTGDVFGPHSRKYVKKIIKPGRPPVNEQASRQQYLEQLWRHCQALPLAALGSEPGTAEEITLNDVYTELLTTTQIDDDGEKQKQRLARSRTGDPERKQRPLKAQEAAVQSNRLVILGDPGSGKSTFVKMLAGRLAAASLGKEDPLPGIATNLLPVLIILRELVPSLSQLKLESLSADDTRLALAHSVRDQICRDLARFDLQAFTSGMKTVIKSGECLLILDGLDEVPYNKRQLVRQAVGAMLTHYRIQRLIITCRIRSYVGESVFTDFDSHTLAPFKDEQIAHFARAWYDAQKKFGRVDAKQAASKAKNLTSAATAAQLRELAENPMLLTTMAIIHQKEIGLPEQRVTLYKLAVDILLRRWQQARSGVESLAASGELQAFLRDHLRLRCVIERLGFEIHTTGSTGKDTADLLRGDALSLLEDDEYLGSATLADEFLDYVDQRSGLLIGRGGEINRPATYSFPHRTFQEYLAGCHLVGRRDVARLYSELTEQGDYWFQAALLGAEELRHNRRVENILLDLAYYLCPIAPPQSAVQFRRTLWSAHFAALFQMSEIERDDSSDIGGPNYLKRLVPHLLSAIHSELPAIERADAGNVLAQLGDPRLEVTSVDHIQFCLVPQGPFWIGNDVNATSSKDEWPQHLNQALNYDYWISKYPVTNGQFAEFVKDGGYTENSFWLEAITAGVWKNEQVKGPHDDQARSAPYDFGKPANLANHPVVGITWYEMLAFVRWLTAKWRQAHILPKDWQVRLPSEAEWEKAARGGLQIPAEQLIQTVMQQPFTSTHELATCPNPLPKRRFPWGDDPESNCTNYYGTMIDNTSTVGCFPNGVSPYGCEEMNGNVWEWTRSLWGKYWEESDFGYPYDPNDGRENLKAPYVVFRVLRGGAFDHTAWNANCFSRHYSPPRLLGGDYSFRVVASRFRG